MRVTAEKISTDRAANRAAEMTTHGQPVKASARAWYRSEHSPIRAIKFWIEILGVPSFVSVHLTRHKAGVEHFVQSMRDDRGGAPGDQVTRLTPVNHGMEINAAALIFISRRRLCYASHHKTVGVWRRVRNAIDATDPDLARFMVPECVYRGGVCPEFRQCRPGLDRVMRAYGDYRGQFVHKTESKPDSKAIDLARQLRIVASMISMGEKIGWGSDTDLMFQAAAKLDPEGCKKWATS